MWTSSKRPSSNSRTSSGASNRLRMTSLVISIEQAGDAAFVGDPADRFGEQWRDGQAADLAVLGVGLAGADRIGDDQLAQFRFADPRRGAAGQHAVGAISDDFGRP